MTGNIVARRYARALFAVGKEKGLEELEAYGKDLAAVTETLDESPQLLRIFRNPIFGVEEKKGLVEKIASKAGLGQMVQNFLNLLTDKERLGILPDISDYYGSLLDAEKGVVRGELITAVDLADAKQDEIRKSLEAKSDQKLILDFNVNKDILGGAVLRVGDKVLDASLRAQLDILKENIKRGE